MPPTLSLLFAGLFIALLGLAPASAAAETLEVEDAAGLIAAVEGAEAGDEIVLAPGTYAIGQNLNARAEGTAQSPIVVRAQTRGEAVLEFDAVEGFKVDGAHWVFEDLWIRGVCADDSRCEHAFHILGGGDHTIIRGNRVWDYNAHIKANGTGDPRVFPDDVLVEGNEFFSEAPRQTSNPVTPIDVVGGRRWVVRRNYIHDFEKAQGNNISYAAFLKGNSRDGLFEQNLVVCEALHSGGIRLGLSLGGGGSNPPRICEEGTCTPEHQGGTLRNNIIANCPADVGIYINEGAGTKLYNNTLINTTGIDVRFESSDAEVRNNLLDGRIRDRNGARSARSTNLTQAALGDWLADPGALDLALVDGASLVDQGEALASVVDDFCGRTRGQTPHDIGALEYDEPPCDTTTPFHDAAPSPVDPDMGMSAPADDMGSMSLGDMSLPSPSEDMRGPPPGEDMGAPATPPDMSTPPADAGTSGGAPSGSSGSAGEEGCACGAASARAKPPWALLALAGLAGLALGARRGRRDT